MNKRANYIYELFGQVNSKQLKKKKNGQPFYQLTVVLVKEKTKKINAFTDSLKRKDIWKEIEQSNYVGKKYLFYCQNWMGSYYLMDWKELT